MPFDDDAPTASMNFPPRITLTFLVLPYISSASAKLAMCSKSGPLHYSQSLLSIEYPSAISSTTVVDEKKSVVAKHKAKGKVQSKGKSNDKMKPSLLDSLQWVHGVKNQKQQGLQCQLEAKKRLSL
jgi:hypothetical protein